MAKIEYNNVGIKYISAVVPEKRYNNNSLLDFMPAKDVKNVIKRAGIIERRFVDEDTCASDLCIQAAEKIFSETNLKKDEIDVLIFISQCPDYIIPATAPSIQNRLGLSKECASFDINLACSGYIYALSTAFAYANQPSIRNVLLLDGETLSKILNKKDSTNFPLYGDAGTATLITKGDFGKSYFNLYSDGSGWDAINIKDGGAKNPISTDSLIEYEREDGSIGNNLQLYMNGLQVFNFTLREVSTSIKKIISNHNIIQEDIDYILFHQANKFMIETYAKKLKVPKEKLLYSLEKYGNTSSVSVPLTMCTNANVFLGNENIIASGYGAGLSWGVTSFSLCDSVIFAVEEYKKEK